MSDIELNREFKNLQIDRRNYENELKSEQIKISQELMGDMGKDMMEVLSGNKKIKLPLKDKIKYEIKNFLRLF